MRSSAGLLGMLRFFDQEPEKASQGGDLAGDGTVRETLGSEVIQIRTEGIEGN